MKQTEYFGLPQFDASDKPTWLVDVNGAFEKTDKALHDATVDADNALANSNNALTLAGNAGTIATNAVNTANQADAKADSAVTTANGANTKADSAMVTANAANTKAENAASTANTAKTTAENAASTANTAKTTAENVVKKTSITTTSSTIGALLAEIRNKTLITNDDLCIVQLGGGGQTIEIRYTRGIESVGSGSASAALVFINDTTPTNGMGAKFFMATTTPMDWLVYDNNGNDVSNFEVKAKSGVKYIIG